MPITSGEWKIVLEDKWPFGIYIMGGENGDREILYQRPAGVSSSAKSREDIENAKGFRFEEWGKIKDQLAEQAANIRLMAAAKAMFEALQRIEKWNGEFPDTGRTWDDGTPMSYFACHGSNGERDFMREIARAAIDKATQGMASEPAAAGKVVGDAPK